MGSNAGSDCGNECEGRVVFRGKRKGVVEGGKRWEKVGEVWVRKKATR